MKGFNKDGSKVLIYDLNRMMEDSSLVPVVIRYESEEEMYAVIIDGPNGEDICYPCEKAPSIGDPNDESWNMVCYIDPEADEYLKTSGKLVTFKD